MLHQVVFDDVLDFTGLRRRECFWRAHWRGRSGGLVGLRAAILRCRERRQQYDDQDRECRA
jgi:hypothetical protein